MKSNGFSLIELVVVIVVLGVLSAAAAPKFINIQGEAKKATLQNTKSAIYSANNFVYSKAMMSNKDALERDVIDYDGEDVIIVHGNAEMTESNLKKIIEMDMQVAEASDGKSIIIHHPSSNYIESNKCHIILSNNDNGSLKFETVLDNC